MKTFRLPDLGEGLPDAEVHEWHVKEGDFIRVDEPLVAMETAKAVVDVPSPYTGKITKLCGKPGDVIKVGEVLVEFEDEKVKDAGTVAGVIQAGEKLLQEPARGVIPQKQVTSSAGVVKAMPAVRALANQLRVDLTQVTPSGANGQMTADDVKRAAGKSQNKSSSEMVSEVNAYQPLKGTRRAMAQAMLTSHQQVVPVTLVDDADIDAWSKTTDITVRIIRAIVAACRAEPSLNAWFDTEKQAICTHHPINLGLAMDTAEGLFVPVLKAVDQLTDKLIRTRINEFKIAVNSREISPEAMKDSTFVLSNFGTFAGRYATPIVVPPSVAILGTGRIRKEAVAVSDKLVVHHVLPLSLTFDHRAVTGGAAARFLAVVIRELLIP